MIDQVNQKVIINLEKKLKYFPVQRCQMLMNELIVNSVKYKEFHVLLDPICNSYVRNIRL